MLKDSIVAGNASIQTFKKEGLHINREPVREYLLLECPSVPANTFRIFTLKNKNLNFQLLSIWFSASATTNNFTVQIKDGTAVLYTITIPTNLPYFTFPPLIVKSGWDAVINTPTNLTLNNILIICQEIAISETIIAT
jgi:hypothetical protein